MVFAKTTSDITANDRKPRGPAISRIYGAPKQLTQLNRLETSPRPSTPNPPPPPTPPSAKIRKKRHNFCDNM